VIQVRLILQPVTVENSAPILLYGNFFRFSPDYVVASNNGDNVFVPADGVDMFVLLRHRRGDGRLMGDIVSLDSVIQIVDLIPRFGTTADRSMTCNTSLDSDHTEAFYLNHFATKENFHAILSYQYIRKISKKLSGLGWLISKISLPSHSSGLFFA
jgi:hypothetical protein